MTAATTSFINVTPGPAAELAVIIEPPAAVEINSGFGMAFAAEDTYGNIVTSFGGDVSVALSNNPADGALSGQVMVPALAGIASFTGLAINLPSTDDTLQATSTGLVPAATAAIDVTPTATQLAVTVEPPTSATAGSSFGLTVYVEDDQDDLVPSFGGNVTVSLASGPEGSNLSGRLTEAAVAGVATFAGLSLDKAGAYTFTVQSGILADATTDSLSVTPGPVAQLVVTAPPPLTTTAGSAFGLTVSAEDTYGNVETSFYGNVTIARSDRQSPWPGHSRQPRARGRPPSPGWCSTRREPATASRPAKADSP